MTIGDTLTKDGWGYDGEKDFWTHPKRQGHIKITIQGWVHKVTVSVAAGGCDEVDIKARDDYRTVKEGFHETDLQEHLNSLVPTGFRQVKQIDRNPPPNPPNPWSIAWDSFKASVARLFH